MPTYSPSFEQILRACPYDHVNNWDGELSEKMFDKEIFHSDASWDNLALELHDYLISPLETNEMIIVYGYSGVGKTTFLYYFKNTFDYFNHYILNFHEISLNQSENPITKMALAEFRNLSDAKQLHAITLIQQKITLLENEFSEEFTRFIQDLPSKIDLSFVYGKLKTFCFRDIFLLFLSSMFLNDTNEEQVDLNVIYFDNLDAVDIEFITDSFLSEFVDAFYAAARLSQKKIFPVSPYFTQKYRFVFCLRDGNYSFVSGHFQDRLRQSLSVIPFQVSLSPEFYKQVILKRISYSETIHRDLTEISSIRSLIAEWVDDNYFNDVFVNLYNSDYRKLIFTLFQTAKKYTHTDWNKSTEFRAAYGTRGSMMRGIVEFLFHQGYLHKYLEIPDGVDYKESGYCHPIRMILNLILNISQRGPIVLDGALYKNSGYCHLSEIVDLLKDIYPCKVILKVIAGLFLFHKHNWVQLVSIYGQPIRDEMDLINLLPEKTKEKILQQDFDSLSLGNGKDPACNDFEVFQKILLRINPAGIIYLKHVQSHFEFYSALNNANHPPLFQSSITELNKLQEVENQIVSSYTFEFENIIDGAYRWVENHHELMRMFFVTRFQNQKAMDSRDYQKSPYSFKYVGNYLRPYGEFHSTRVVMSHIDYIDTYRLYFLDLVSQLSNCETLIPLINKKLVNRISIYNEILKNSFDTTAIRKYEIFKTCIDTISASDYRDTKTRVKLN